MERRGSDDTTSWTEKYGWAATVQDACSTMSGPGPDTDPGPRSGVVVIVGAGAAWACDRFTWVRGKKELREEKKTRRHGFGAMTWCGQWAQ